MKNKIFTLITALATMVAYAQVPCEGGMAGSYPCNGYDMQAHFSPGQMGAGAANDSWGWTDPDDGTEYALIALDNGTAFFDISTPTSPVYLGKLPTHTSSTIWRDVKVYNNYAFIVSEAGGHGMQVFDLTRLRNVANPPETFTEDAHYDEFGSAHNIAINEDTGYAYAVGTSTFGGGYHFVDISDPLNPVAAGGYGNDGYCHDAQIVIYNGPDSDYVGQEILFGANASLFAITDVTDKNNPVTISSNTYPSTGYTHQGWLTEDHRYWLLGDEGDEFDFGFNTRTVVFDLLDLDNPVVLFEYFGSTPAVDHNGYVKGDKYYLANYSASLRVMDIGDIANSNMSEIGFFDDFPQNNNANYSGAWNVYPFFDSGNIIISGSEGFTLVIESNLGINDVDGFNLFEISPNPATDYFNISSKEEPITQVEIYNILGQTVSNIKYTGTFYERIDISNLNSGLYLVKINDLTTKRLIKK
jgi:choice-of-anchor B domain-containing protein